MIIAVLNQKGGVGKTTIATCLAHAFEQDTPGSTLLIDQDPQGSALDWNEINEGKYVPVLGMSRETLPVDIRAVSNQYQTIIIDGAPAADKLAVAAMKVADLVVIPVQPSPYDVWSSSDIVELVKARQEITDGKLKACILISRAIKNTKIGKDVLDALEEFDLPVLEHRTTSLVAYPTAVGEGQTVLCPGYEKAAKEIEAIKNELVERFDV